MFQYGISWSENKCTSEHLKGNKQKKSAGKKTIEEKQTVFFLKVCNVLSKILHYIRKYFVSDVQPHSITWRSKNDLESECS